MDLIYVGGDNNLASEVQKLLNRAEVGAKNEHVVVLVLADGPSINDSFVHKLEPDHYFYCLSYVDYTCDGLYVEGENIWRWTENTASTNSLAEFISSGMQVYRFSSRKGSQSPWYNK